QPAAEPAAVEPDLPPAREEHSLEVRNPADDTVLRTVGVTEAGEIAQKVERARRAQPDWAAREFAERAAVVRAFRELLESEAEEYARITTSEMGKPIRQSRNEVKAVLERIDWNLQHVGAELAARTVTHAGPGVTGERITHEP